MGAGKDLTEVDNGEVFQEWVIGSEERISSLRLRFISSPWTPVLMVS